MKLLQNDLVRKIFFYVSNVLTISINVSFYFTILEFVSFFSARFFSYFNILFYNFLFRPCLENFQILFEYFFKAFVDGGILLCSSIISFKFSIFLSQLWPWCFSLWHFICRQMISKQYTWIYCGQINKFLLVICTVLRVI